MFLRVGFCVALKSFLGLFLLLELLHTLAKWFILLQTLHIIPLAGHGFPRWSYPQLWHFVSFSLVGLNCFASCVLYDLLSCGLYDPVLGRCHLLVLLFGSVQVESVGLLGWVTRFASSLCFGAV